MKKIYFLTIIIVIIINNLAAQSKSDSLFDSSVLHEIRIEFADTNFWDILITNFWSGGDFKSGDQHLFFNSMKAMTDHMNNATRANSKSEIPYLAGSIYLDGQLMDSVGVRLKGYSSFFGAKGFKKSLKIDFDAVIDTQDYDGIKKINLNNGAGDPSMQRDFISYYMLRKAGVAAPRVAFAKVYINNNYWGLYTLTEQVDKAFLTRNFASGKGNLYKSLGFNDLEYMSEKFSDYHAFIELKTNEDEADGSDYVNFVKSLNNLNQSAFSDSIQKLFNIDYYFKVLAIDIISKNWDSFIEDGRNFYLYHEPVSDLFYWIPWDYNLAWDGAFSSTEITEDTCNQYFNYTLETIDSTLNYFIEFEAEGLEYVSINFGDDNYLEWFYPSTEGSLFMVSESHNYLRKGIYPIFIYANYSNGCNNYVSDKVVMLDTAILKCPSILKMERAYFPDDTSFKRVFAKDHFCCDCQWDLLCESFYKNAYDTNINDPGYKIDYYTDKVLIKKLLNEKRYRQRYLDVFKFVLDSVFEANSLMQLVQNNMGLIREAVYTDTNYLYSTTDFENDLQALCENKESYTSLSRVFANRDKGLDEEYKTLNHQPLPIERAVGFNDIVINEIMANASDTSHNGDDWIELYNNTSDIIPLNHIWISDETENPMKYNIPRITAIKPDGFVTIWADNKDKKNGLHANFKLSASGEDLILYHDVYDTIDLISFGLQPLDSSYARYPNGTGSFKAMAPTLNDFNMFKVSGNLDQGAGEFRFILYPNPATDRLYIQTQTNSGERFVVIFDILGKAVYKSKLNHQQLVDISHLKPGIYTIKIKQDENLFDDRFVKY